MTATASCVYTGRVKLLTVRLPDELHAAVMAKAGKKSTNVSALVRRSLESWVEDGLTYAEVAQTTNKIGAGEVDGTSGAGTRMHSGDGQSPAESAPADTPPPEPLECTHPKAALVQLAGGLARCGACGTNRKADGRW